MELSLAFSPCLNDTFAFHAMINRLVDTEGLAFKLSYHAFFGRTAPLLLQTAYPCCTNLQPMLFSEIEGAGLRDEADAGVLIREGTFTYKDQGLELSREIQQEHIRLFVNDYTPDIGEEGKKAVTFLHAKYREGSLFVPVS